MASIIERNGRYLVRVRRQGYQPLFSEPWPQAVTAASKLTRIFSSGGGKAGPESIRTDTSLGRLEPRRAAGCRPLSGRPTPVSFSGLFLPSVEWELKTEGMPWRSLEKQADGGPLLRALRRALDKANDSGIVKRRLRSLSQMARKMPAEIGQKLERACLGDEEEAQGILAMGDWTCFVAGWTGSEYFHFGYYAELERDLHPANRALVANDFRAAAEIVETTRRLKPYWSGPAIQGLSEASNQNETFLVRLSAYLELQCSIVARFSVESELARRAQLSMGASLELTDPGRGNSSIGGRYLKMLRRYNGVRSLSGLLDLASEGADATSLPSEASIKRWSSGNQFPSVASMEALCRALATARAKGPDRDKDVAARLEVMGAMFWAARRIDAAEQWLLYLAERSPQVHQRLLHVLEVPDLSLWMPRSFQRWHAYWKDAAAC